jgi:hypothetical protein
MKTSLITLSTIAALMIGICDTRANLLDYRYDSLAVDSIAGEQLSEDEISKDSFPTEEQFKEVTKKGDTTFITLGNKKIKIIEENGETQVKIQNKENIEEEFDEDIENDADSDEPFEKEKGGKEFKGHWAGFEFGLNNYVDKDLSISRTPENEFMDVNTGKSWNFNLNFAQYSAGFGTDHIGIVTGMGFEWSNYHLNDSSIQKLDGEIAARVIPESTTKNRLQTTYLTIPLLIEVQFPGKDRDDRAYLSAGVIGGVKLFSHTKIKYVEDGIDRKEKIKSDYYLSPLRYGFTARAGYKALKLYVNYYPTPLFMANRGPELYPVAAGLVVSF